MTISFISILIVVVVVFCFVHKWFGFSIVRSHYQRTHTSCGISSGCQDWGNHRSKKRPDSFRVFQGGYRKPGGSIKMYVAGIYGIY